MQFLLPVSLLVAAVSAQTTLTAPSGPSTTASTACAAQNVLDQCVTTNMGYVDACASNDYNCLCSKWNDVLTCYLQCPADPDVATARDTKASFCQNASNYNAVNSLSTSPVHSAPLATADVTAASTPTGGSGAVKTVSGSSSSSSPSASSKNDAGNLAIGAGSVMMGLAGVIAAVL